MQNTECNFFTSSILVWNSMLRDFEKATKTIYVEQYIFEQDVIGNLFIETLIKKSKEGVRVKMVLDMVGSVNFYNSRVPDRMREAGVEIKFFNVVKPWKVLKYFHWFLRNHRKLLIVDEEIAYTGGLGIRKNMTFWRDTTARIQGPIVSQMVDSFNEMFKRADDHGYVNRISKYKNQVYRENFVTNDPFFNKRFLYYRFIYAFRTAQKSIYITNPYFIPDRRMSRVLKLAVKRGVDVRVIVPDSMDVPVLESASNATLEKFLKHKVRVYKYMPEFLHAKTAVVDGDWASFGSFNLDNLSLRYNHEANIVTYDKKCVEELTKIFFDDLEHSEELDYETWKQRGLLRKTSEFFASLLSSFL